MGAAASHAIVVAGLGRCGTSMLMQMLCCGGVPCVGRWPSFEVEETRHQVTPAFMARIAGQAVKVLDPQRVGLPGDARVIWLDRDHRQQAKSHAKFLAAMTGLEYSRDRRRALAGTFARDVRRALAEVGSRPLLRLRFEEVLRDPLMAAINLKLFLGVELDPAAASRAVHRRPASCAPDLSMELALIAEGVTT